LSKFSLIEQPSSLYCEKKADLWRHINETELEEADSDSGYCSLYHNQLNLQPAINPSYLPVITHAGQLMIISHEPPHYEFSHNDGRRNHSVIVNDGSTGGQLSWHYRKPGAVIAVDETTLPTANVAHNAGTHMSRRSSQHNTAAVTSDADNTAQTVSRFLF